MATARKVTRPSQKVRRRTKPKGRLRASFMEGLLVKTPRQLGELLILRDRAAPVLLPGDFRLSEVWAPKARTSGTVRSSSSRLRRLAAAKDEDKFQQELLDAVLASTTLEQCFQHLAFYLASVGEVERAGRAWRLALLPRVTKQIAESHAAARSNAERSEAARDHRAEWKRVGWKIHEADTERGRWPMKNSSLAAEIANLTDGRAVTIKRLLPEFGLSKAARLADYQSRVKTNQKRSSPKKSKRLRTLK